ncbi:MAG: NADP-specific glutamate dehydrogenase [Muribaculaceae bacterium]|nr:NADP-specific glutamate dehydrogenase [Muribaculaceae bacterium]MCI9055469.1 NADP-specific glutamate dehydrogenase [Muribaculaceae bacterium]
MDEKAFLDDLRRRFPHEPEYIQAVEEVVSSIADIYDRYPAFKRVNLLERLCIPDRIISFRVSWVDDHGNVRNNMGYRVQHNNAIGPYKGGIRFHSSVNLSILKFLAFEQTFKNSLTTLAMGGAKGGSDFSPRGKSDMEIMRFCQAFVNELWRQIGPDTDVPAGDIGVGAREVGYMFGWYKKMTREFTGTFTGKGLDFGGSLVRPEATGYGNVYFLLNMLATRGISLEGKRVAISGSGNVALYTAQKLLELGAKVVSLSDSDGSVVIPEGLTQELFDEVFELKTLFRGRISEFAEKHADVCEYYRRERPWRHVKADIAMPSATQNELDADDARALLEGGCIAVSEGANMPSTPGAIREFQAARILYAPGKAANAGGVSVSGLEMAQNSQKLTWSAEEVDNRLREIMADIHAQCVRYGKEDGSDYVDYVRGANTAGFLKVARAMMAQGVV